MIEHTRNDIENSIKRYSGNCFHCNFKYLIKAEEYIYKKISTRENKSLPK